MTLEICLEAIDLLLNAIYSDGDRCQLLSQFTATDPRENLKFLSSGIGISIFTKNDQDYLKAVLFIKKNGLAYLNDLSTSQVRSLVTSFFKKNYWYIMDGAFSRNPKLPYKDQIPFRNKLSLANALMTSELFLEKKITYLFPFNLISTKFECRTNSFFILDQNNISTSDILNLDSFNDINFSQYPCVPFDTYRPKIVKTWIGINAPNPQTAHKNLAAILGTLALYETAEKRYIFSEVKPDTGCCYFHEGSFTFEETPNNTPALMFKLIINLEANKSLEYLSNLINTDIKLSDSRVLALTHFYKSWFEKDGEQYRTLFSCLDSLIDTNRNHSSKVKAFIMEHLQDEFSEERIKLLLKIRGDVVHGKSPNLYECKVYDTYMNQYLSDPLLDLQRIVEISLKASIFKQR